MIPFTNAGLFKQNEMQTSIERAYEGIVPAPTENSQEKSSNEKKYKTGLRQFLNPPSSIITTN
jgi:hypothetical protein